VDNWGCWNAQGRIAANQLRPAQEPCGEVIELRLERRQAFLDDRDVAVELGTI
jgi:hypothetical protein